MCKIFNKGRFIRTRSVWYDRIDIKWGIRWYRFLSSTNLQVKSYLRFLILVSYEEIKLNMKSLLTMFLYFGVSVSVGSNWARNQDGIRKPLSVILHSFIIQRHLSPCGQPWNRFFSKWHRTSSSSLSL